MIFRPTPQITRKYDDNSPSVCAKVPPKSQPAVREQPVKKTILIFGLISGAISSVMMIATVPLMNREGFDHGYVLGYTTIVLSLMLTFFGVRSYRDNVGMGHITFGRAFLVGLGITLISCIFYVVTWEVIYYNFMPDFLDKYGAHVLQKMQAAGATAGAIQEKSEELNRLKVMYKNPLFNAAMTFIEPFPVGLVITLLSAAILRRKTPTQAAVAV
jgi:hypothetical protein